MPSLQPDVTAPFSSPLPVPQEAHTVKQGSESANCDVDMEQQVVSRLHLNEDKVRGFALSVELCNYIYESD